MIFIEITDAVIIYPTSAMESVYEKIQALPSAEEIVELVERISVATASQIPDIQGIMEQEKEAKKWHMMRSARMRRMNLIRAVPGS
ncbi:MAG: hypothetical protein ACLTDI_12635 [Acutalibacteraceae bacterium]